MHEILTILADVHSFCLSRGSSQLHCAKMAEQIKMLFGVNTHGVLWNIVIRHGSLSPTERGRGPTFKFWDPLIPPERLKLETCNFACMLSDEGPNENYAKVGHRGSEAGSRDLFLNFCSSLVSPERLKLQN